MNFSIKLIIVAFLTIFNGQQEPSRISLHMETKQLSGGKYIKISADLFYKHDVGEMVTHYTYPEEYVFLSNAVGESKVYYPNSNEVMIKVNQMFSSENNLLFYFMSSQTFDLGLKDQGFKITDTRFDEDLMVTTWLPPAHLSKAISKVEMVHEEYRPIYAAYYHGEEEAVTKKVYYYDYNTFGSIAIPLKITEFNYLPTGDSTVSRMIYSDVKIGFEAESEYFDFKIPEDAKVVEENKQ